MGKGEDKGIFEYMSILIILGIVVCIVVILITILAIWAKNEDLVEDEIKKRLRGRVIKLSPAYRKKNKTSDKYARILEVRKIENRRVIEVEAELFPSQKTYTEAKKQYDVDFAKQKEMYKERLSQFENRERMINGTS